MEPTKEQMYKWYIEKRKTYGEIMEIIGTKNNRKIKKLLDKYGIKPRGGSEAVKTQWENNPERRKKQAEISRNRLKDNKFRRLSEEELKKRFYKKDLIFKNREIIDEYSIITYVCRICCYKGQTSLKNDNGCPKCAQRKQANRQRIDFGKVKNDFEEAGLILLEDHYVNGLTPMAFICPKHKEKRVQYRTYGSLKYKNLKGCQYCTYDDWEGSKISESEKLRRGWRYKEWREKVFERDNYTCQYCDDNTGGNLEAHHIRNFAECEKLRFDIDNGIILCKQCHNPTIKGSFHYEYGTKNNNEEQLKEYLENH